MLVKEENGKKCRSLLLRELKSVLRIAQQRFSRDGIEPSVFVEIAGLTDLLGDSVKD